MKTGWMSARLGEVAIIQSGAGFPEKHQGHTDHSIPFYKVSDMNIVGNEREMNYANNSISEDVRLQLGAKIYPKGSTIFPKIGGAIATNKKRLTTTNSCVDNNVMGVIPKVDKITSKFLFYFFQSFNLSDFANDAHLPSIKSSVVSNWGIKLPRSLSEQQRIVTLLDEAFDGIATAKANAEKNLQNAGAIFESHLQSVFTQGGLGWSKRKLKEVCDKITDGTHQTPTYFEEGTVFLSSRNVTSGKIDWEKIRYIDEAQHLQMHKRVAPRMGDILLAKNGTTGVAAMVDRNVVFDIYVSLALLRAREEILANLLLYFVNSPVAKAQFNKRLKGSGVPNLHLEEIREVEISFPTSIAEQRALLQSLDSIASETQRLEVIYQQKLTALDELKRSLLHQAFSGAL